jgi:hypothetical protein
MLKRKAALVGLLAALICLAKFPMRVFHGYLWAEDGAIFIRQSAESAVSAFWTPYAGYLHTIPRLIVGTWSLLADPVRFPHGFAWTCIGTYFLIASALFCISRRHFPNGWRGDVGAATVGLLPFLVPQSGEIYINVTNLQWFMAPLLAFLLIDMCTGIDSAMRRVAIFCITATGPFGVMMLPFAGALWIAKKQARLAAAVPYAVACIFQIAAYLGTHENPPKAPLSSYSLLRDFIYGAVGEVFAPLSPQAFLERPQLLAWTASVALAVALFSRLQSVRIAMPLLAMAFALWVVGVTRQGVPGQLIHWDGYGARYLFLPELCIGYAVLFAVARKSGLLGTVCAVGLLGAMVLKTPPETDEFANQTAVSHDGSTTLIVYPPARTLALQRK